ncbi:MAG: Hsp33 family molecular chaperone HslO [Sphingobacteriia bacterium]|nr:Hsp33 family molecular chaperone HslO [Sphingobacteriia bacterium]
MANNFVRSFIIDTNNVRGKIVKLDNVIDNILKRQSYPDIISKLIGESMLALSMIGYDLKTDGIITLQFTTNNILKIFVADITASMNLRGYAEIAEEADFTKNYAFSEIMGKGQIVITIDPGGENSTRYQGIVEINGNSVSEVITNYIINSEQINTVMKLHVEKVNGNWCGGGVIIQKMPKPSNSTLDEIDDNWEELRIFTESVSEEELVNSELSNEDLLKRLYGTHDIVLFDKKEIGDKCRCSPLKALKVLKSLPEEELESLKVDGKVVIKCQFCNTETVFEHI